MVNENTKIRVVEALTFEPQSRYELASALNMTERTFRQAVRELRREGLCIITSSHEHGYRLGTLREAEVTARELRSRAYDLLQTANAMEGKMAEEEAET